MNKIIVISGPTATGKTKTSIQVSQFLRKQLGVENEIINFDSLLFYKELNIGTAKPSQEELKLAPHHLINIESIKNQINASDFVKQTIPIIENLFSKNNIPILVGGSGFYIRALIKGMYQQNNIIPTLESKSKLTSMINSLNPNLELANYLKKNDPSSLRNIHQNDTYRLSRAVEFHLITGALFSTEKNKKELLSPYDFDKNTFFEVPVHHIYLDIPKPDHFKIIQERTNIMLQKGLIHEVKELLKNGHSGSEKPLRSIGYKETISLINGDLSSELELAEKINISTRQLAKSQRTFFNKILNKKNYDSRYDFEKIVEDIQLFLAKD